MKKFLINFSRVLILGSKTLYKIKLYRNFIVCEVLILQIKRSTCKTVAIISTIEYGMQHLVNISSAKESH